MGVVVNSIKNTQIGSNLVQDSSLLGDHVATLQKLGSRSADNLNQGS